MTATGKKPQKKIPYEIREDPSDSVASTSQVKSLLRKQVQVLRHTHFIAFVSACQSGNNDDKNNNNNTNK